MTHVSFEALLPACEELFRLAESTKTCSTCVIRDSDTLLQIYLRTILLMKAAVVAHTPLAARAGVEISLASCSSTSTSGIIVIPSPMFMGTLELSGRQSTALAYELVARRVRLIGGLLGRMEHAGAVRGAEEAGRVLAVVGALLEKVHGGG
jgi:hypothetical protein